MNVSTSRHFSSPSAAVCRMSCLWLLSRHPMGQQAKVPWSRGVCWPLWLAEGEKIQLWDT